jgi:hypothetical protein
MLAAGKALPTGSAGTIAAGGAPREIGIDRRQLWSEDQAKAARELVEVSRQVQERGGPFAAPNFEELQRLYEARRALGQPEPSPDQVRVDLIKAAQREEEDRRRKETEEANRRAKEEEEAKRRAAEEEAKKRAAEEEAKKRAAEEEAKKTKFGAAPVPGAGPAGPPTVGAPGAVSALERVAAAGWSPWGRAQIRGDLGARQPPATGSAFSGRIY